MVVSSMASEDSVNPAEAIAVFSHNLLNDVSSIAVLVHLLDVSRPSGSDAMPFGDYLTKLTLRSERLVERLQHGVLGLAPEDLYDEQRHPPAGDPSGPGPRERQHAARR